MAPISQDKNFGSVIKNNKLYVQSGGGIVYDSDPQKEYEESVNKAKAIINAAEISLGNNIWY